MDNGCVIVVLLVDVPCAGSKDRGTVGAAASVTAGYVVVGGGHDGSELGLTSLWAAMHGGSLIMSL